MNIVFRQEKSGFRVAVLGHKTGMTLAEARAEFLAAVQAEFPELVMPVPAPNSPTNATEPPPPINAEPQSFDAAMDRLRVLEVCLLIEDVNDEISEVASKASMYATKKEQCMLLSDTIARCRDTAKWQGVDIEVMSEYLRLLRLCTFRANQCL